MLLKLAYCGDPILRKKAEPIASITPEIHQFIEDMIETMQSKKGIGLAAPQVHRSIAVFIVHFPEFKVGSKLRPAADDWGIRPIEVFINPKILEISQENWAYSEGCLSIPGIYEDIERPLSIKIRAQNLQGEWFENTYEGYEARMILHENDHLNGVLFIDRMNKKKRKTIETALREIKKKHFQNKS